MRQLQVFILAILGMLSVVAASTKKISNKTFDGVPYVPAIEAEPSLPEIPHYTSGQFAEEMKQAKKRGERKIAAVLSDANLQSDFRTYRDRFLALKDTPGSSAAADALDLILFELEQPGSRSEDLELFAAQLIPLRSYRGFFHRVRPLARKYPIVQSYLITMAKQMASNINVFLVDNDSENMKVVFRYISEPFKYTATKTFDNKAAKEIVEIKYSNPKDAEYYGISQFSTERDIQNWLAVDALPRLELAVNKLNKIDLKNKTAVWDNKVIAGTNSYEDNSDRFRALGEAERNAILSNFYGNIAAIHTFNSYNANGLLALVRELGFLYGVEEMDVFNPKEAFKPVEQRDVVFKGASAEERTDKIKKFLSKSKNEGLFTLLSNGQRNMRLAYGASLASNEAANLAWNEIKQRPNENSLALDGAIFRPFTTVVQNSLNRMTSVLKGKLTDAQITAIKRGKLDSLPKLDDHFVAIRSAISSDVVQVNTVKFYFDSPKNLRDFLPDDFEKGNVEQESDVMDAKGNRVRYRNYFKGNPISWVEKNYVPYFRMSTEGRPVSSDGDIKTILRVTNQSWGGLMIGATLNSIML
ncbi:MAG: hypothetical protein JNL11_06490 [Bdellovibrionaceae bacterium]|nr:hypothetical protein [Pseudobdellovibrionaceae bacterium]